MGHHGDSGVASYFTVDVRLIAVLRRQLDALLDVFELGDRILVQRLVGGSFVLSWLSFLINHNFNRFMVVFVLTVLSVTVLSVTVLFERIFIVEAFFFSASLVEADLVFNWECGKVNALFLWSPLV